VPFYRKPGYLLMDQSNTRRKISRRVNQGRQALANRAGANLAEPLLHFAGLHRHSGVMPSPDRLCWLNSLMVAVFFSLK
jgi:hypothetical protein